MGWREWFGFTKPRDAPDTELPKIEDNVRDSGGIFVFGQTLSGERVDEKSALQISTVYACVRLLAETVASLPLHLYRFTEKGDGKERATEHPLYKILYRQANPEMTSFSFREAMMMLENQGISFVQYTLMPWLTRFEQAIIKDALIEEEQDEYFPKFNVDGLMRGDYKSCMDGYAVGFANGFLSPNDIRRLENMDLIPEEDGGDDYYLNGSYTKLKNAGSAYVENQMAEQEKQQAEEQEKEPDQTQPDETQPEEGEEETPKSRNHAQRHARRKAQRRGGNPKN